MGIKISHSVGTKITIPRKMVCKAPNITNIIPSGIWKNKKCFIIGGGPSLERFNFSTIENENTIGVNKALIKFPCKINYSMDYSFFDLLHHTPKKRRIDKKHLELRQKWENYKGIKVFYDRDEKKRFNEKVYIIKRLHKPEISFSLERGIYGANNSGFGSIMLAIAMGCRTIGLFGFDMKVDFDKSKTHWHDGYENQNLQDLNKKFASFIDYFEKFSNVFLDNNIYIYHVDNPTSALTCFPNISLKEFLRIKNGEGSIYSGRSVQSIRI